MHLHMFAVKEDESYISKLNPQQREAVEAVDGPVLVLAGAGSGKTRVLTHRVAHLVLEYRVDPQAIFAVTFTNKATNEMRERLAALLGERAQRLWVSTFHASALRILRRHAKYIGFNSNFVVYDTQDCRELLKRVVKAIGIDEKAYSISMFDSVIDEAKNQYKFPEQVLAEASDYEGNLIAEVYDKYQRALKAANAMDFGDLLVFCLKLFEDHPEILKAYQHALRYVLVDEYQDTNVVQYRIIKLLTAVHKNIFVVGDDDQSIYAFRGATVDNILNFENDFPGAKVIKLEQNYRSTGNILEAANSIICKNSKRKDKRLWTDTGKGAPVYTFSGVDEAEEAQFVARTIRNIHSNGKAYQDIAVFYRTNAQSRALEEALFTQGIPYRVYGGQKFYERKEIKDLIAYLRLIQNEADNGAFLRIVNNPPRGIGPSSVQNISERAQADNVSLYAAAHGLAATNKNIAAFLGLIETLKAEARRIPLGELISAIIEKTEYAKRLESSKDVTAVSRVENIWELKAIGAAMEQNDEEHLSALERFMDRVALTSSAELPDEEKNEKPDQKKIFNTVSLMTLHLAKGLEYPVVFFTGLEEGLVPHHRAIDEPNGVEEERRLCYVGVTRAREVLYLTRAQVRGMFSSGGGFGLSGMYREPSRYVFDISKNCLESRGGDFLSEGMATNRFVADVKDDVVFDEEFEERINFFKKKNKKKRDPTAAFPLAVADLVQNRILAAPEELKPGVRVLHPSFGEGVIESLDRESKNAKVSVRFDGIDLPKTLVLKHSKLSLA